MFVQSQPHCEISEGFVESFTPTGLGTIHGFPFWFVVQAIVHVGQAVSQLTPLNPEAQAQ